jgi:DNA repair protein RadC
MALDLFEQVAGVAEAPVQDLRRRPANRLAERADLHGFDTLDERETLELYISRTRPQGASTLAAMLLARFGDLQHVLGATLEELARVIDRDLAVDLKLLHATAARVLMFPMARRCVISSWTALLAYLRLQMAGSSTESVRALWLDKKNQLLLDEVIGKGSIDHAPVYVREVIKRALEVGASAFIIAHLHPSGDPTPSSADVEITKQIRDAGKALRISLHDHIIVGGDQTVSMKALGLI